MNGNLRGEASSVAPRKTGIAAPRFGRIGRCVRRKLIVPYLRQDRPADYSARGVFVGLLIGMTPTLGLHFPMVFVLWTTLGRFFPRQKFNLLVAMAWTCVMNPLTVAPLYYLFFVTGRVLLGGGETLGGFESFNAQFAATLPPGAGWLETAWTYLGSGFDRFGLPMFVGCIPWAILTALVGYRWSHRFILSRRLRRARRVRAATH